MGKARPLFIAKNVLCSAFQVLESYLIYYTTPSLRLRVCVCLCVWVCGGQIFAWQIYN